MIVILQLYVLKLIAYIHTIPTDACEASNEVRNDRFLFSAKAK